MARLGSSFGRPAPEHGPERRRTVRRRGGEGGTRHAQRRGTDDAIGSADGAKAGRYGVGIVGLDFGSGSGFRERFRTGVHRCFRDRFLLDNAAAIMVPGPSSPLSVLCMRKKQQGVTEKAQRASPWVWVIIWWFIVRVQKGPPWCLVYNYLKSKAMMVECSGSG